MSDASLLLKIEPQNATHNLLDVSVTERGGFRTCRRQWFYETIENLQRKGAPPWHFEFGTWFHELLAGIYAGEPLSFEALKVDAKQWIAAMVEKFDPDAESHEELLALSELGIAMYREYQEYDIVAPVQLGTPLAVEGKWIGKAPEESRLPKGYPKSAQAVLHESGRFLVPIVHPDTKEPVVYGGPPPCLSARIDLLTERKTPKKGLWIVDHKTTASSPNDRGLDFDDQITGYCYVVWRWTGEIPRGVVFNYAVKKVPKEPRYVQATKKNPSGLSTAKDQLTTPDAYREALKDEGLMIGNKVTSESHADCLAALLERGWDPFFKRFEVMRNEQELLNFEKRLFWEYRDMYTAWEQEELRYPNPKAFWCPGCSVREICQAMEDGSDADDVIESQFVIGEDRKA